MNLDQIQTYLAVIQYGGFREAARNLNMSQPSVTQHIKKLEESVGHPLIIRERTGCLPAPGTEVFIRHARAMVNIAERARLSLQRPSLTIGSASNLGIYLLQPHFRSFFDLRGNDARLEMIIDRNDCIIEKLEHSEVDVATLEWWDHREGYLAHVWRDEAVVVIAPPGHPLTRRKSVEPADLVRHPIIGGEAHTGTGRILRRHLGALADQLSIRFNLGSTEAVKSAVRAGLGISMVLASSVEDEIAAGCLESIQLKGVKMTKQLYVVHPSGLPQGHLAVQFASSLRGL